MANNDFFAEAREQSQVKASIIAKYFWAWAKVVMPTVKKSGNKIAYIDLFAGPGRYKDGTQSTPLLVLKQAIREPDLQQSLVTIFNDADSNNSHSLRQAIRQLEDVDLLRFAPEVTNKEVGVEIVRLFERVRFVPTFFFVDPWGYKGLSLRLVNSVLKDWGCDCVFFFNYNRINMGLPNRAVNMHLDALFGQRRADRLRDSLTTLRPEEREIAIVEEVLEALQEMGGRFVLPFRFRNDQGSRTSHYLIFVSKNFRGYEIMREIMARESSSATQGVASFEYCAATERQPVLLEYTRPLDELGDMLLAAFSGRQVTMEQVYQIHSVGKPYIKANYKDALRNLEAGGHITISPPAHERPWRQGQVTMADKVVVTFPARSE